MSGYTNSKGCPTVDDGGIPASPGMYKNTPCK